MDFYQYQDKLSDNILYRGSQKWTQGGVYFKLQNRYRQINELFS